MTRPITLFAGDHWSIQKRPYNEGRRLILSFEAAGVHLAENERSEKKARRLLREQLLRLAESAREAARVLEGRDG